MDNWSFVLLKFNLQFNSVQKRIALNTLRGNCRWLMNWLVGSYANWLTHGVAIWLNQWLIAQSVVSYYFFYFSSASLCCTDPSSFILSSAITSLLLGDIRDIFCWVVVVLKVSSGQKSLYCMCVYVGDYCTHSTVHTHSESRDFLKMLNKCRIQCELVDLISEPFFFS